MHWQYYLSVLILFSDELIIVQYSARHCSFLLFLTLVIFEGTLKNAFVRHIIVFNKLIMNPCTIIVTLLVVEM